MKWSTEMAIGPSVWKVAHGELMWTVGSCFADNLGARMADRLFDIRVNPFGVLFNPASIAGVLDSVISGREYDACGIIPCQGLWHCLDFATVFSRSSAAETADAVNGVLRQMRRELPLLKTLIITFGSTHIFEYKPTGRIVGNCHKLPAADFSERDLTIDEIVAEWVPLVGRLRAAAPRLKVIFTVSPVRHKAYGLHADRLSKSRLLLAVDEICTATGASYFPSYELLTDELRDYRFYAADLVHPSEPACDYIFERWADAYCTESTRRLFAECLKFTGRLRHVPKYGDRCAGGSDDFAAATRECGEALVRMHPELARAVGAAVSAWEMRR